MTAAVTPQVYVSDLCIIQIPNWKKFNPRPDRANFSWFRMENNFFHDQSIFLLNNDQKMIYLFILCEASKKNTETVKLSARYVSAVIRTTPEMVQQSFRYFADLELIKMTEMNVPINPVGITPAESRHDAGMEPSLRPATNETYETNVTNETKKVNPGSATPNLPMVSNTAFNRTVWDKYKTLVVNKFGSEPVRNAKVNSHIANLTKRIPHEDIFSLLEFYFKSENSFYVKNLFDIGHLVQDAEKLHLQMKSGFKIADTRNGQLSNGKYLTPEQKRKHNSDLACEEFLSEIQSARGDN